jgi:hypothetical protein
LPKARRVQVVRSSRDWRCSSKAWRACSIS